MTHSAVRLERKIDRGARNLAAVFFAVVGLLLVFYGYLAWRSLHWSPLFFIQNSDSERSRIALSDEPVPALETGSVARGRDLYLRVGCSLCHGLEGKGGVVNPNYVNGTFPALNQMAERLFLYEREDVDATIKVLESGEVPEVEEIASPRAPAVIAQYQSVKDVILNGNPAGKKDPAGVPPIDMPDWKERLSIRDVNDIIAYLLSLQTWDESPK
ncbi:MAG: c-type cytochrome [Planctomycetes bacterium]|nr:c-type cytochrome [Planctomycetota bacterium]